MKSPNGCTSQTGIRWEWDLSQGLRNMAILEHRTASMTTLHVHVCIRMSKHRDLTWKQAPLPPTCHFGRSTHLADWLCLLAYPLLGWAFRLSVAQLWLGRRPSLSPYSSLCPSVPPPHFCISDGTKQCAFAGEQCVSPRAFGRQVSRPS